MFQILCWCVGGERVSEEILPVPTWAGGTTQSELATVKETAAKRALCRIPILPSVRTENPDLAKGLALHCSTLFPLLSSWFHRAEDIEPQHISLAHFTYPATPQPHGLTAPQSSELGG